MKFLLSLLLALPTSALAQGDIDWICEGQTALAAQVGFNLLMNSHDGKDYRVKRMEHFLYNGQPTSPIDLTSSTAFCGWDREGKKVYGPQEWKLEGRVFTYSASCPSDNFRFQAECRD